MNTTNYQGMAPRVYQTFLNENIGAGLVVDGREGPKTYLATLRYLNRLKLGGDPAAWPYSRQRMAVNQHMLSLLGFYKAADIDGYYGPDTAYALEQWQNLQRETDHPALANPATANPVAQIWPTYGQLESFYGKPGTGQMTLELPFPMKVSYDLKSTVHRITIHSKCGDSYERILQEALKVYGYQQITELGLDLFGGCFNNRLMRGSKTKLSVHAYSAAVDQDPDHNQLRQDASTARFARPAYDAWWAAVKREGWVSLGRARNYDWMHIQACRL